MGYTVSVHRVAAQPLARLPRPSTSALKDAHEALHAWIAANGRQVGGWSWEIYGDWNDDPRKLETQVLYLLQ